MRSDERVRDAAGRPLRTLLALRVNNLRAQRSRYVELPEQASSHQHEPSTAVTERRLRRWLAVHVSDELKAVRAISYARTHPLSAVIELIKSN